MTIDFLSFALGAATIFIMGVMAAIFLRGTLTHWFQSLSHQALQQNNQVFLDLAGSKFQDLQQNNQTSLNQRETAIDALIKPVAETLQKMDEKIQALEIARTGAYAELKTQLLHMTDTHNGLRAETSQLVRALRAPKTAGGWGEMQLRRVVEMAGMIPHCDFTEQTTLNTDDGRLRPDMIIKLPGGKTVVVDAKTPLDAWLDACNDQLDEAARNEAFLRHARNIRKHIQDLSDKKYQAQMKLTPDFVVMFLPDEGLFAGALRQDAGLIDFAAERNVIPASPLTLLSMLRAIHFGWRQDKIEQEAEDIARLGSQLYQHLIAYGQEFMMVGKRLGGALESYNKAVRFFDKKLFVPARKLQSIHQERSDDELPLTTIDQLPIFSSSPEIQEEGDTPIVRLVKNP